MTQRGGYLGCIRCHMHALHTGCRTSVCRVVNCSGLVIERQLYTVHELSSPGMLHVPLPLCRPKHTHKPGCCRQVLEAILFNADGGELDREPVSQARRYTLPAFPVCLDRTECQPETDYSGLPWNPRAKHSKHLQQWIWPNETQRTGLWSWGVLCKDPWSAKKPVPRGQEDAALWTSPWSGQCPSHHSRGLCCHEIPCSWPATLHCGILMNC